MIGRFGTSRLSLALSDRTKLSKEAMSPGIAFSAFLVSLSLERAAETGRHSKIRGRGKEFRGILEDRGAAC